MSVKRLVQRLMVSSKLTLALSAALRRALFWYHWGREKRQHSGGAGAPPRFEITGKRLMVLVPHPDDETMGCHFLLRQGGAAEVTLLYITDGGDSQAKLFADLPALRRAESREATRNLVIAEKRFLDFPDGHLAGHATALAEGLRKVLANDAPDIVLAPAPGDLTPDHAVLGQVAESVFEGTASELFYYRSTWSTFGLKDADGVATGDVADKADAILAFASQAHIPLLHPLLYSAIEAWRCGWGFGPAEGFVRAARYATLPPYPPANMLHWRAARAAPISLAQGGQRG